MMEKFTEMTARVIFEFSPLKAFFSFLVLNIFIFFSSVFMGSQMLRYFADRRVCRTPEPVSLKESVYCVSTVILNSAVTLAGWHLWKLGIIKIKSSVDIQSFLDILVLF
ncbi:MAG TPA: hypothetical protein PKK05_05115, partial [Leptospiraceae bacterium]|nr:hypothetical protein [Leptospiraceae bacterium]